MTTAASFFSNWASTVAVSSAVVGDRVAAGALVAELLRGDVGDGVHLRLEVADELRYRQFARLIVLEGHPALADTGDSASRADDGDLRKGLLLLLRAGDRRGRADGGGQEGEQHGGTAGERAHGRRSSPRRDVHCHDLDGCGGKKHSACMFLGNSVIVNR
ncbi:hypothetical protein ACFQ10_54625 [Streptomyces indonesiensis]